MCYWVITKKDKELREVKDKPKTVYKIVYYNPIRNVYVSCYLFFHYRPGKVYKGSKKFPVLDTSLSEIPVVREGFHSYSTKKAARAELEALKRVNSTEYKYLSIVKAELPVGTKYLYKHRRREIVSNRIKLLQD